LYLKEKKKQEVRVITYNLAVREFCKFIGIKCFFFKLPPYPTGLKNFFKDFYKLWNLKNDLDRALKLIDIKKRDSFFFFGACMTYSGFYLAKEWAKRGKSFFKETGKAYPRLNNDGYYSNGYVLRCKLHKFPLNLVFGLNLGLYDCMGLKIVFGIDKKFLEKNNIENLKLGKTLNELKAEAVNYKSFSIDKCENLFMPEDAYTLSLMRKNFLPLSLYEKLRSLPGNIAIKPHPIEIGLKSELKELKKIKQIFSNFEILPHYIPVEILLNKVKRNVIAIASGGLIPASKIKHLKAISLLELVQWKNKEWKRQMKEYLARESGGRIIFVNSFEELKGIMGRT